MSNTRELLEQCQVRLLALDSQVDRIRKNSAHSNLDVLPVAPPPSPAISAAMGGDRALSRCHECHGPLAGYHKGYPHGIDTCELEHYDLCVGGIVEGNGKGGNFWRGCPSDFTPHPDREELLLTRGQPQEHTSGVTTESTTDSDSSFEPGSGFVTPQENDRETRSKKGAAGGEDLTVDNNKKVESPVVDPIKPNVPKEDDDLLLHAEIAEIASREGSKTAHSQD